MAKSIVKEKSFQFALNVINLYKFLVDERKEYVMAKQVLRSGTSVGANISEALASQSKRDFIYKLNISLKEISETIYWIDLLQASGYLKIDRTENLRKEAVEIKKILTAIIKTSKINLDKSG
ncbi:four helix bundle protein [Anaerobacillus sp. CMMVII]|uniref:four helix bundle protein n=1 Tax=Anaerobacillus sp. CMMVII TaxID=2755588 RepID=UPI0021B816A2|nr:four helix bundle protein [Anaerobacillus sp. CMMVII]MCT8140108.1 four helix bundle protein [Anaerobacillus sp. CMMVII]